MADLADIWIYTDRQWGNVQADRYAAKLSVAAHDLLANAALGRPVDFSPVIRRTKAEHHFIYFRPEGADVLVLRILHEKMDASLHLSDLA